jgi:hypothetical protein
VETAKSTIDDLLPSHPGFSLDFVNEMYVSELEVRFFDLVKQVSGTFRGGDSGTRIFRDFLDAQPLDTADEIFNIATGLEDMLEKEEKESETVEYD